MTLTSHGQPTPVRVPDPEGHRPLRRRSVYQALSGFARPEGNLRCCVYSPCGRYFAWVSADGVAVADASAGHLVASLAIPNVFELGFSPRGSFLSTWERPAKDDNGDATKNLKVWRTIDPSASPDGQQQPVGRFVQKSQAGWNLQYTADERFCARMVTNEVQFYDSNDLATVWNKLRVEGVADFALAPGQAHSVAVFIPERKVSQPASQPADTLLPSPPPSFLSRTAALAQDTHKHHEGTQADSNTRSRANPRLSRSSKSPCSTAPFRKRRSTRATRSS